MALDAVSPGGSPVAETVSEARASGESLAAQMKDVKKARLHREALADPSLYAKLVKAEASPVYNSRAELIQGTGLTTE
jgi:HD-like signal output (HDOD) protein